MQSLPRYVAKLQALITDPNQGWLARIFGDKLLDAGKSVGELVSQGAGWIATFAASLWSGGKALFSVLSLLVITPVVAFYLLCDWDRLIKTVDGWIPLPHRDTVHGLAREINIAIGAFVRGQAGICLVLGAFYALCLTLVGLNFGFLIGFIAGLISFIPYVGSLTGLLIGCIVAVAQFWPEWMPVALVVATFAVGQVLEGYVLAPKLVGEKVGLHPVWLMFALIAFGYLFGFVGLLVAVPVSAAIGVLLRFAMKQYRASPIYTGEAR
jgi:predicted PurR-regulated permease PerM